MELRHVDARSCVEQILSFTGTEMFLFDDPETHKIYISKDLEKLRAMNDGELFFIYGVVETESGEVLMNIEWSYAHEPIMMSRFVHKETLIKYKRKEVVFV